VSRIAKMPISFPKGIDCQFGPGTVLAIKGPKGRLILDYRGHVSIKQQDDGVLVQRHGDTQQDRAYHGLYYRLIRNMIIGVNDGFSRELEMVGVGYRAQMDGKVLVLSVGYSHDVNYPSPEGITISTPKPNQITIAGTDKQKVGQVAAEVRAFRPPEPYKGKGIRYVGEHVRRKVGKTGA
jgi:large subunit ribosomal protein L6